MGHTYLGLAPRAEGQEAEARKQLDIVLSANSGDARTHETLAVALAASAQFEEARKHLELALKAQPNDPEPTRYLGRVKAEMIRAR
jgi:Flp pilus assembly protein TadD